MLQAMRNACMGNLAPQLLFRSFSSVTVGSSAAEQGIAEKLQKHFKVISMDVQDTSGGCGAMYRIALQAEEFKGQSTLKQHQQVNKVLAAEIAQWHGLTLVTSAPAAAAK